MQYPEFVEEYIDKLEAIALDREAEGANTAKTYASIAEELRQAHRAFLVETLSIRAAAEYSGFSEGAIRKWSAAGMARTRAELPWRPQKPQPPRIERTGNHAETSASKRLRRKVS